MWVGEGEGQVFTPAVSRCSSSGVLTPEAFWWRFLASTEQMRNIKLTIAYDGANFHGWQFQPGFPTIQGEVDAAARKITQERIVVHGASRTDAGVHALGQVGHFKTASLLSAEEFQRALNALLPPSIRIVACEEVGHDFHSRWLAPGQTDRYRIYRGRVLPPFYFRPSTPY